MINWMTIKHAKSDNNTNKHQNYNWTARPSSFCCVQKTKQKGGQKKSFQWRGVKMGTKNFNVCKAHFWNQNQNWPFLPLHTCCWFRNHTNSIITDWPFPDMTYNGNWSGNIRSKFFFSVPHPPSLVQWASQWADWRHLWPLLMIKTWLFVEKLINC